MKKIKKFFTKKRFSGFTLIELLITIAIIAILSAIVITALGSSKDKANKAAAKRTAQSVMRQIEIAATEGGTINPPTSTTDGGGNICTSCSSTATWPSIAKTGYSYDFPTSKSASSSFELKLTKADKPTIAVTFTNDSGVITEVAFDPCTMTTTIGTVCNGGAIYAGTYGGSKYITTSSDAGLKEWGAQFVPTLATSTTDGAANTIDLKNRGYAAATYCSNLNYGGYSTGWYMPAKDELNLLYINKAAIGGFNLSGNWPSSYYYSSTEYNGSSVWNQKFDNGVQNMCGKNAVLNIRCVRKY